MDPTITTASTETDITITVHVPRAMLANLASTPATVTQRTAEGHFGLSPRAFREMARSGKFPAKRIGKTLFAAYADVHRALTEGAEFSRRVDAVKSAAPASMSYEELERLTREAARFIAASSTRAEFRARKREVTDKGMEIEQQYKEQNDDGSPNPAFDKRMRDYGMALVFTSAIQKFGGPSQVWLPRREKK